MNGALVFIKATQAGRNGAEFTETCQVALGIGAVQIAKPQVRWVAWLFDRLTQSIGHLALKVGHLRGRWEWPLPLCKGGTGGNAETPPGQNSNAKKFPAIRNSRTKPRDTAFDNGVCRHTKMAKPTVAKGKRGRYSVDSPHAPAQVVA